MTNTTNNAPLEGVLLVLVAVALLCAMDATIKVLMDGGLAVAQILALRSWLLAPPMAAYLVRRGGWAAIKTGRAGLHMLRVVLGTGAPLFFFSSLKTLPLAEATTIFFGATFMMTALSVPLLKERVGPHRWAAVVVGFLGVVVAMRPTGDVAIEGSLYALASSLSYALFILMTRKLGSSEGAFKQVLYFHAWIGMLCTLALPFLYRPFTGHEVGLVTLAAVLVSAGGVFLTRAFSIAPVGLVAPFEYSGLVWAAVFGFVLWEDVPGPYTVIGAGIIVASGLYLTYRETQASRRARKESHGLSLAEVAQPAPSAVVTPPSLMSEADKGRG